MKSLQKLPTSAQSTTILHNTCKSRTTTTTTTVTTCQTANMLFCRSAFRILVANSSNPLRRQPQRNLPAMSSPSAAAVDSAPEKRARTVPLIGTHDGIFHCDEVLGCFMLRQLPAYADAKIVRTRNEDVLRDCDIVIDVGGVFDKTALKFDHHQRSFQHTLSTLRPELGDKYKVRLSSAGLVYTYFGEDVIREILRSKLAEKQVDEEQLRRIYVKLYESLIQEIDGIDNGVPMFDGEPLYRISSDLSSRVATFNAAWNEDESSYDAAKQFELAQQLVGVEFVDKVLYYAHQWWPARAIVAEAVRRRHEFHASGAILELKQFCPWKDHLFELEQEQPELRGQPRYLVMENRPGDHRVICVPLNPKSFVCRKFLHKEWRGLRDAELAAASGIEGANFVHATGFIGGAKTHEAALRMAVASLESTVAED